MAKIGLSSRMGPKSYWYEWFEKKGCKVLEISLWNSFLPYELKTLVEKAKPTLKIFDLSMHSTVTSLFSDEPNIINEAQQKTLLAEIKAASIIGAKEMVFHMPMELSINKIENEIKRFFKEAVQFAKENKIKLFLENNESGTFSSETNIKWFLENVKGVGLCLDIGHLNIAANSGLTNIDKFIEAFNESIEYVHVHNNNGSKDSHSSLSDGTFPYEKILPILKNVKKFIIETKTYEDSIETEKILKNILT